jgi:hypothetical protein
MTERGEPKDHDAPASERPAQRVPPARTGTAASIGQELGKLDFEPDALLEGLFNDSGAPPPPAVNERESFAPVAPVTSSFPPPEGPQFTDDDEQTSVWRMGGSSAPPDSPRVPVFGEEPASGKYEPESFHPPPEREAARFGPPGAMAGAASAPPEPDEAERTVRRSMGPAASKSNLPSQPPEPVEAERTARRSVEPLMAAFRSEPPTRDARALIPSEPELDDFAAELPSQPPEAAEVERTVRRSFEPAAAFPSQPPEQDEAERTVRRSPLKGLAPTLPPTRAPVR